MRHRTTLKNRIQAMLITFGHPCPVCDLFGYAGRQLLERLQIPDPWRRNVDVSLGLIDDPELQIARLSCELERQGADHRYVPLLLMTHTLTAGYRPPNDLNNRTPALDAPRAFIETSLDSRAWRHRRAASPVA